MIALPLWNDRKVEDVIGNLLRAGVLLSALIVFIGAVVYLARPSPSRAAALFSLGCSC